jgi:hypothetical protein
MQLRTLPVVDTISPEDFKNEFYDKNLPVIKDLSSMACIHKMELGLF